MKLNKISPKGLLPFAMAYLPLAAFAQTDTVVVDHAVAPHFVTAVAAGLVLAFAFQAVFTLMSLASGLSLTPNIEKMAAKHKADRLAAGHPLHMDDEHKGSPEHHTAMSNVVVNELGIWTLVTTSVALFLATWLGLRLSYATDEYRYVLAMVVWAAFFTGVIYLEYKGAKSLIGGIMGIAIAGFQTSHSVLHGLLTKSPEKRLEDFGRHTLKHIYEDLSHAAHNDKIHKKLGRYLNNVKPDALDYDRIHDDLAGLLGQAKELTDKDVDIDALINKLSKKLDRPHKIVTRENAAKLYATVRKAADSAKSSQGGSDGLFAAAAVFASLTDEQKNELQQKVKDLLAKTNREELNPDAIIADIESIIDHPGASLDLIRGRLSQVNADTVKSLLAQTGMLDESKANRVVDSVLAGVEKVRTKYQTASDAALRAAADAQGKYGQVASDAAGNIANRANAVAEAAKHLPHDIDEAVAKYFDSLNAPELNYDAMKLDLEDILHDPREAPHILKARLAQMDMETVKTILKSNPWITPERYQAIVDQVHATRDDVLKQVTHLEDRAVGIFETTRRKAVIAAEHARAASAAACWWIVWTAFLSAAAALGGAYYSTFTF